METHPVPQPEPAAATPYAGVHDGPQRVLELHTRRGFVSGPSVQVTIDGAVHPTAWGRASFEIPADRPVGVTVHQPFRGGVGVAGVVLPPGPGLALEYVGPAHPTRVGALGPPGTVRQQGRGCQVALLVPLLLLLVLLAVVVTAVVAAL